MAQPTYTFHVGMVECTVLLERQMPAMEERVIATYTNAPRDELLAAFRALPEPRMSSVNPLLLKAAGRYLLVDTGLGGPVEPGTGNMFQALRDLNIALDDIAAVMISHCHLDHIGGLLNSDGGLMFPNADHLFGRIEWDYWNQESVQAAMGERAQILRRTFDAVQPRLRLVEADHEIAPCVRTVAALGHTPGHLGLVVADGGQQLLVLVDALHSRMQMQHPEWSPSFDVQPDISPVTRRAMLERAADSGALASFYHLQFPGVGRVVREGSAFAWQPRG